MTQYFTSLKLRFQQQLHLQKQKELIYFASVLTRNRFLN